jgi:hypothetical protein
MPWGDKYFGCPYSDSDVAAHARVAYVAISERRYSQVFVVPTEPLATLLGSAAAGRWISEQTVEAANVALWRIGVFNQLVDQQTDFNSRHLAEFRDDKLSPPRREVLAKSAEALSRMLHGEGIGDAEWYQELKRQLAANIKSLDALGTRSRWKRLHRLPPCAGGLMTPFHQRPGSGSRGVLFC